MGYYINPMNGTKEEWLARNARKTTSAKAFESYAAEPRTEVPIYLIYNDSFSAAGIAYNREEFQRMTDPEDPRPLEIFLAPIDKVIATTPYAAVAIKGGAA